jgi:adenylate cyclase
MKNQYQQWQQQFMWQRLRLGLIIGMISLFTFMVPKLFEPHITTTFLIIIFQTVSLSLCFLFLHTPLGRRYPSIVFLFFSTIITIPPHYEVFQHETAQIDFISPTLMFLGQATLLPLHWPLHLLSQLIVVLHFFLLLYWFHTPVDPIYSIAFITLFLYFFWFGVICNLSVYLYERLQYAEFKSPLRATS